MERPIVSILVTPRGKQVLLRHEVSPKSINGIILPPSPKFDELLTRSIVLAVGELVIDLKPGDKCYIRNGSGIPVENFYRTQIPGAEDIGMTIIAEEEKIVAKIEYLAEPQDGRVPCADRLNVVKGLPMHDYEKLQEDKALEFTQARKAGSPLSMN